MFKIPVVMLLGILLIAVLSACGGSGDETPVPTEATPTKTISPAPATKCPTYYWFDDSETECRQKEFCGDTSELQVFDSSEKCKESRTQPQSSTECAQTDTTDFSSFMGDSWTFRVSYDLDITDDKSGDISEHNTTTWSMSATETTQLSCTTCVSIEVAVDGDAKRWLYYAPMDILVPMHFSSAETCWNPVDREFLLESTEFFADILGGMDLRASRSYIHDEHPEQMSVGDKWDLTSIVDLPILTFHQELPWNCEVVGTEEITVPLGTFNCYKIELNTEGYTDTYWWAIDEDFSCPVKQTLNEIFLGTQVSELVSYNQAQ